jgi:hypothetical protein
MTKEIDYVELLKLAHEKLGSQSDMIAELEKELAVAERNLGSLSSTFEDIESVFCDQEGDLVVEPFNGKGLSRWLKVNNLEQQSMGRLDGVAYALNMYCTTMSPKEFPPIGKYYADQLQAKALKEQE